MSPMQPKSKWQQFVEKVKYGELLPEQYRGNVFKFTMLTWFVIPCMIAMVLFKEFWFMSIPFLPIAVWLFTAAQKYWNERGNKWYLFTFPSLIVISLFTFVLWLLLKTYVFYS